MFFGLRFTITHEIPMGSASRHYEILPAAFPVLEGGIYWLPVIKTHFNLIIPICQLCFINFLNFFNKMPATCFRNGKKIFLFREEPKQMSYKK